MEQGPQSRSSYHLFLSYCRQDLAVAEEFIRVATDRGLAVWYDGLIEGGQDWRSSIVDALTRSSVLLILFSEASNRSTQLIKEIAIADRANKLVIPVLIQNTEPTGAYLYEMASRNWISLYPDPIPRLGSLTDSLLDQIGRHSQADALPGNPIAVPERVPAEEPVAAAATAVRSSVPPATRPTPRSPTPGWFPLKTYDQFFLGPILATDFIWQLTPSAADDSTGAGFGIVAISMYMFVIARRNAKLNRGIWSLASFASYASVFLLLVAFGLVPDLLGNTGPADYTSLAVKLVGLALIAVGLANVLQIVLRKLHLRNIFHGRIHRPLAPQTVISA